MRTHAYDPLSDDDIMFLANQEQERELRNLQLRQQIYEAEELQRQMNLQQMHNQQMQDMQNIFP